MSAPTLEDVRAFWDAHPCGRDFVDVPFGTPEFFEAFRAYRYRTEWHLDELVPFEEFAGRKVLEVGCGLGADGSRFAAAGADYTGIDLTPAAVAAARRHFEVLGLSGAFLIQNAQRMDALADASFDAVYSHGVLHHTPDLDGALAEVARVLRPGGRLILMVYHRASFNYRVRILLWMRAKVVAYLAIRRLVPAARRSRVLEAHLSNLRGVGWRYLGAGEFPHHAADGPDCPVAFSYTRSELSERLAPWFQGVRFRAAHLPIRKTFPWFPEAVEGALARRLGWYLFTYARRRG